MSEQTPDMNLRVTAEDATGPGFESVRKSATTLQSDFAQWTSQWTPFQQEQIAKVIQSSASQLHMLALTTGQSEEALTSWAQGIVGVAIPAAKKTATAMEKLMSLFQWRFFRFISGLMFYTALAGSIRAVAQLTINVASANSQSQNLLRTWRSLQTYLRSWGVGIGTILEQATPALGALNWYTKQAEIGVLSFITALRKMEEQGRKAPFSSLGAAMPWALPSNLRYAQDFMKAQTEAARKMRETGQLPEWMLQTLEERLKGAQARLDWSKQHYELWRTAEGLNTYTDALQGAIDATLNARNAVAPLTKDWYTLQAASEKLEYQLRETRVALELMGPSWTLAGERLELLQVQQQMSGAAGRRARREEVELLKSAWIPHLEAIIARQRELNIETHETEMLLAKARLELQRLHKEEFIREVFGITREELARAHIALPETYPTAIARQVASPGLGARRTVHVEVSGLTPKSMDDLSGAIVDKMLEVVVAGGS